MATDVAAFAKQLKEECIDAAKNETEAILADAKTRASAIIEEAKAAAGRLHKEAEEEIAKKRQRSEAELMLVARDLILKMKQQIEEIAAWLLKEKIAGALSTEEIVKKALIEVVKCNKTGKAWELALGPAIGGPLANAIVEHLFKETGAEAKLVDGFRKAGFQLKTEGGTQVIEVSEESVADAFKSLLSGDLQKMIDSRIKVLN